MKRTFERHARRSQLNWPKFLSFISRPPYMYKADRAQNGEVGAFSLSRV